MYGFYPPLSATSSLNFYPPHGFSYPQEVFPNYYKTFDLNKNTGTNCRYDANVMNNT